MALALLILGGYASFSRFRELSGMPAAGDTSAFADPSALSAHPELPVVPGDNDLFLRLEAHGPVSVRERCVFPTDPSFIRLLHQNTNFLMTEALRQWTQLPIPDLLSFLIAHPQFYVIQRGGSPSWLILRMLEDDAEIALQGTYAGNSVYLVQVRR